jgi:hypothetical protein
MTQEGVPTLLQHVRDEISFGKHAMKVHMDGRRFRVFNVEDQLTREGLVRYRAGA